MNASFYFILLHNLIVGGAIYIHAFGAYFGLTVSMMSRKRDVGKAANMEASRYTSDIFSLVSFKYLKIIKTCLS